MTRWAVAWLGCLMTATVAAVPPESVIESRETGVDYVEKYRLPVLRPLLDAPAPALHARTLEGGNPVDLEDYRGQTVLVLFWAHWVEDFVHEVTRAEQLHRAYQDQGLVVLGIHAHWETLRLEAFIEEHDLTFLQAIDDGGQSMRAWEVDSFPDFYIVDGEGVLRYADVRFDALDKALDAVLGPVPE